MIVVLPAPAKAGLKLFELTPVPEYVPPNGVPPLNANVGVFEHAAVGVDMFAVVTAFTTIDDCAELTHPFVLVYE